MHQIWIHCESPLYTAHDPKGTILWLCSHGLESRSERRFRTWFGPFLILAHVNAKLFQIRLLKHVLKHEKRGLLDRDPPRKPDSRTCERKALSERDLCVCILEMRAEAMHKCMGQSARADCAVGAKYYLAVRRSWLWLGRRLQHMWTHVVQITIPITFWIAIRNVFRNMILAHVNIAFISPMTSCSALAPASRPFRGSSPLPREVGWLLRWDRCGWTYRSRGPGGGGPALGFWHTDSLKEQGQNEDGKDILYSGAEIHSAYSTVMPAIITSKAHCRDR